MSDIHPIRTGAAEIAANLRRDIAKGALTARERLAPERELAAQFNVARGTVREALTRLAEEGLVEIRPGSGTYVTEQQPSETSSAILNARPLELIDARFAIEPHMCRLAVLHARRQDLDQLESFLEQMEDCAHDSVKFSQLDTSFHTLLAESTGNTLLIWVLSQINTVRGQEQWSRMRNLTLNEETINNYNIQHRQILNAIRTREPERAAVLMKEHLESARLSLTRSAAT